MNAQVKLDPIEEAGRALEIVNRRNDVFEIDKANLEAKKQPGWQPYDVLLDELHEVISRTLPAMLSNYKACDDAENGAILGRVIGGFAIRVVRDREKRERQREAEELWDEFIPSWRSHP